MFKHFVLEGGKLDERKKRHGGPNLGMWPYKPFFCVLQVSYFDSTLKSDYRGIVVLPCPHQSLTTASDAFCVLKLPVCGDV